MLFRFVSDFASIVSTNIVSVSVSGMAAKCKLGYSLN